MPDQTSGRPGRQVDARIRAGRARDGRNLPALERRVPAVWKGERSVTVAAEKDGQAPQRNVGVDLQGELMSAQMVSGQYKGKW